MACLGKQFQFISAVESGLSLVKAAEGSGILLITAQKFGLAMRPKIECEYLSCLVFLHQKYSKLDIFLKRLHSQRCEYNFFSF